MQVPRVFAAIDERLRLFSKFVDRIRHFVRRRHQQFDGRRFLGAELGVLRLELGLEFVASREEFGLLLGSGDSGRRQVFVVERRLFEDLGSRLLRLNQVLLLRVDQGRQQALELVDNRCRFLKRVK